MSKPDVLLAIDSGTTNTRVWVLREGLPVSRAQVQVGVRDTAATGSTEALKQGVRLAIQTACEQAGEKIPEFALAAGMITSELGLVELPHVPAKAGRQELSEKTMVVRFPDLFNLQICFAPGVRSGPWPCTASQVAEVDLIRGEETEVVGALEVFSLRGPLLYIHPGSHTKAIRVGSDNRIESGITTLAGELLHGLRTNSVLAGVLGRAEGGLDPDFLALGADWVGSHGLARTLFMIRVLEQSGGHTADQLNGIAHGAFVQADVELFYRRGFLNPDTKQIVLSGQQNLLPAWAARLRQLGYPTTVLENSETENCFIAGLRSICGPKQGFAAVLL